MVIRRTRARACVCVQFDVCGVVWCDAHDCMLFRAAIPLQVVPPRSHCRPTRTERLYRTRTHIVRPLEARPFGLFTEHGTFAPLHTRSHTPLTDSHPSLFGTMEFGSVTASIKRFKKVVYSCLHSEVLYDVFLTRIDAIRTCLSSQHVCTVVSRGGVLRLAAERTGDTHITALVPWEQPRRGLPG